MTEYQPQEYVYLRANDKAPKQSLEENIDLKTTEGHYARDATPNSKKFLFFKDHMVMTHWFLQQETLPSLCDE